MFCPRCGANLPDGSGFCGACGSTLSSNQPAYQQSAYRQPAYGYRPQPTVSKGEYLKTLASPQAMSLVKVAWGLLVVCVLVLALGWNASVNGAFYDIPLFKMILGEDYDEAMGDLTDLLEDSDEGIDELRDLYEDEIKESDLDELIDSAEVMAKNPSLKNIRNVAKLLNTYGVEDVDDEIVVVFDAAIIILTVGFAVAALFTVLGGLLKSGGVTIFALILSMPVLGLFGGVLYAGLALVAYIAQAVVLGKINKEYRDYKRGRIPACGY